MANRLQLKRGTGAPGTIFYEGEPVYDKSGKVLYVGNDGGTGSGAGSAVASAGAYSAVTEILNQASSTASGFIKLLEDTDNGNHNVSLKAPASISSNYSLVLPNGTGSDGQVLKTDGSGTLAWVDQTSGFSGFDITDGSNTESIASGNTITFTAGEGINAVVSSTDTLTISAELASETNPGVATFDGTDFTVSPGGDVTLKAERIQDIAGAMFSSNTETLITATYEDSDGTIDLVVDNDLSNYDNSTSAFITAASTHTLTNKTFDADGTGNSISNLAVADFAAAAIVTESEGIGPGPGQSDNDTTLPTSAAVKDYVDTEVSGIDLTVSTAGDSGTGSVATSQTLTVSGTANEIVTSASGQGITISLPDDVTIGNDLTVNGNLNVVGTAVTFSAETTRIEDRILELGLVNGAAPGSATTWDLAVAFNYNSSGAKKAGVAWLNNGFMAMLSELAESSDTGNADPQITATTYAKIAGHSLYLGGIESSNEIIDNNGAAVNLVFDGGSY